MKIGQRNKTLCSISLGLLLISYTGYRILPFCWPEIDYSEFTGGEASFEEFVEDYPTLKSHLDDEGVFGARPFYVEDFFKMSFSLASNEYRKVWVRNGINEEEIVVSSEMHNVIVTKYGHVESILRSK